MIEGQVVKIVGQDQVMIKTADGKEFLVSVTPQTKYVLTAKGGTFVDLKPNAVIGVQYTPQNQLNVATEIVSLERTEGQIVRVVGKDQLVIKTADGKEVVVYVSPETKYQLAATTPAPATPPPVPTFTTLQPGWPVSVYTQQNVVRTGPFGRRVIVTPPR
jgi:translation initiation factor IF-1